MSWEAQKGAVLEVGGTKSKGSGSTRVTVLDGGRGMHGRVGATPQWAVRVTFRASRYKSAGCLGKSQSVLITRVPDEPVAVSATGGEVKSLAALEGTKS